MSKSHCSLEQYLFQVYYGDSYAKDLGIKTQRVGGDKASTAVDQVKAERSAEISIKVHQEKSEEDSADSGK